MARLEIDFLTDYDDASLLAELQRIAKATDSETVTEADTKRIGRVSHSVVVRRFGSLRHALRLAGLRFTRFMKATDAELIAMIIDLWQKVLEKKGRTPDKQDLKTYGFSVSGDRITRRFGSWRKALARAHASITEAAVSSQTTSTEGGETLRKRNVSLRKRFFVLKRDQFSCVRCGKSGVGVRLEVHHRFPFAKGGSDLLSNLDTLCYESNRGQRDTML